MRVYICVYVLIKIFDVNTNVCLKQKRILPNSHENVSTDKQT